LLINVDKKSGKLHALSSQRIANIAKKFLDDMNIDINEFASHSFRGATLSKLLNLGVPFERIKPIARWATFETPNKFYWRKCLYTHPKFDFSNATIADILRLSITLIDAQPAGRKRRGE
jgi:hypothetical protein